MANNYCESSSFLTIKNEDTDLVKAIVERVSATILEDDQCGEDEIGVEIDFEEGGIWFHHDESINTDHLEMVAKALIEELEIDEPFVFSWAYTCSKPRIDEFGGGACVVRRGKESIWVDATSEALRQHREEENADDS